MSQFTDRLKHELRAGGRRAKRVRMCASQYRLIEGDFGIDGQRSVDGVVAIELDEDVPHGEYRID